MLVTIEPTNHGSEFVEPAIGIDSRPEPSDHHGRYDVVVRDEGTETETVSLRADESNKIEMPVE